MAKKVLIKIASTTIDIFKIANRRGYGALCRDHVTEGSTALLAFKRMVKALKRSGYLVTGEPPKAR